MVVLKKHDFSTVSNLEGGCDGLERTDLVTVSTYGWMW